MARIHTKATARLPVAPTTTKITASLPMALLTPVLAYRRTRPDASSVLEHPEIRAFLERAKQILDGETRAKGYICPADPNPPRLPIPEDELVAEDAHDPDPPTAADSPAYSAADSAADLTAETAADSTADSAADPTAHPPAHPPAHTADTAAETTTHPPAHPPAHTADTAAETTTEPPRLWTNSIAGPPRS